MVLQCGFTFRENDLKMQDDLTSMFNNSMNFANSHMQSQPTEETRPLPTPTANYSISQHYHHSAHQVPLVEKAEDEFLAVKSTGSDLATLLSEHSINPFDLSPSQVALFENASLEQKERLIQLWKISPPLPPHPQEVATMEMEEEQARARYEAATATANSQDMDMQEDKPEEARTAEPYIKSGYEILAERDYHQQTQTQPPRKVTYNPLGTAVGLPHTLDPAFSSREWWRDFAGDQPMEFQYGMYQSMHQ